MEPFDVLIVGAGVVGCALARELARYRLRVGVVDREADVAEGTSKANSAIVHTGFDAKPGSLESRLVRRGHALWTELAPALHVTLERPGALVVAVSDDQLAALEALRDNGRRNGVTDLRVLSREEVLRREPALTCDVRGGLDVPGESIIDPFAAVIAQAENAAAAGVEFFLGEPVQELRAQPDRYCAVTPRQTLEARWLVDAAGLWSDEIAGLAGWREVRVTPRKGEFVVFDKPARRLVHHILLPVPTKISKGILIAPTVFGNLLLGPTAVDGTDKTDLSLTADGFSTLLRAGRRFLPALQHEAIVATYVGLRAVGAGSDYGIEVDGARRLVVISGIRSTGLTASPAIAEEVVTRLRDAGLVLRPNPGYRPDRPAPAWRPGHPRPCADPDRVARAPAYGRVVCLCESVSEGEILDAMRSPLPARTLDGIKKRTWAMAGRCQAYYCTADLLVLLARQRGVPLASITKRGVGSELTTGPTRTAGGTR